MNNLKVATVVMAHNPFQYFAEFIIHHKNLTDQIYVIDHRSGKKFSDLDVEGVTFIESNQVAQFQSEVTNALIRDFRLYDKYDWIFVLDIDEFLPFASKAEANVSPSYPIYFLPLNLKDISLFLFIRPSLSSRYN